MINTKINNLVSIVNQYNASPSRFEDNMDDVTALESLLEELSKDYEEKVITQVTNNFLFGYKFERINQEFDLIKAIENPFVEPKQKYIINIELKKSIKKSKHLKRQLRTHRFYFNKVGIKDSNMYLFGYCEDEEQFFEYRVESDGTEYFNEISSKRLFEVLEKYSEYKYFDLDTNFKVDNILISPLNNWKDFVDGNYLLTDNQEQLKNQILSEKERKILRVTGAAGSGKTLVLYDIVRELVKDNENVVVIPCHTKIAAHGKLAKYLGFEAIGVGSMNRKVTDLSRANYIFVDEAQRMSKQQIERIISEFQHGNLKKVIFFYDELQWLKREEKDISEYLKKVEPQHSKDFYLRGNIRSNYFLTLFSMKLLHSTGNFDSMIMKKRLKFIYRDLEKYDLKIENSVNIYYFDNYQNASVFMSNAVQTMGSTPIYYTPSTNGIHEGKRVYYDNPFNEEIVNISRNPHKYMGQEFESITIPMDSKFSYNENGSLIVNESCNISDPVQMLYEMVTRARNELNIVVINNFPLFEKLECIKKETEQDFYDFLNIYGRLWENSL